MPSLWEPTKTTESYWRGVLRKESLTWEQDGGEYEFDSDKDCWLIGGEGDRFTDSEIITVPDGEAKWITSSHDEPMELPAAVNWPADRLEDAPQFDNDESDANEDTWAAERVKEYERRAYLRGLAFTWVFSAAWERDRMRLGNWCRSKEKPYTSQPDSPRVRYCPPAYSPFVKSHAPTPKPAGWKPFIPKDPHAVHAGKLRLEPMPFPVVLAGLDGFQQQPVPMPWRNPDPEKVAEWAAWGAMTGGDNPNALGNPDFLSSYLKRLLFMNDYVATDPYRVKPMFTMLNSEGKPAECDMNTRRVQLRASCGSWGCLVRERWTKSIEYYDHRIIHKQAVTADGQVESLGVTESHTWERGDVGRGLVCRIEPLVDSDFHGQIKLQLKTNLRWEIRKRDRNWNFRQEKVPGYKLHDPAGAIMAHLGCSRATAFRKIAQGFRLSDCVCEHCVQALAALERQRMTARRAS